MAIENIKSRFMKFKNFLADDLADQMTQTAMIIAGSLIVAAALFALYQLASSALNRAGGFF